MAEHELQPTPGDRRRYVLDGIGALRLDGFLARGALAEARSRTWRISRRGFWQPVIQAIDEDGAATGEFEPHGLRRGGELRWAGRELLLRPADAQAGRFTLQEGPRVLAIVDGLGWGRRVVEIVVEDPTLDPGLVLFATFVARAVAEAAAAR